MLPPTAASAPYSSGRGLLQDEEAAREAGATTVALQAQAAEADALRARLRERDHEWTLLQGRLQSANGELSAAEAAAASATELLDPWFPGRTDPALTYGVERCRAERGELEDRLQQAERLLWERDAEIARLRRAARELEASRLHGEMELTALAADEQTMDSEIRALGADNAELRQRLQQRTNVMVSSPSVAVGSAVASRFETSKLEDITSELAVKRNERIELRAFAEEAIAEVHRLEHAVGQAKNRSAMLAGADNTLHEVEAALKHVIGLATTLRARGCCVRSREVWDDPVDVLLHGHMRQAHGDASLSLLWRIGPGDYVLGEERVRCIESHGRIVVGDAAGRLVPIGEFTAEQATKAGGAGVASDALWALRG
eukprot:NODE_3049_length_2101_cov_8.244174.p1 GENE.NODE_3049_length_2101_cov_8.244174~~NODE_3049_length_2101_cov_8.244174.p1  ORF type:complete len:373 (+),score=109.15 NODE_3049_length_2101_cov_8.244174:170-1288(+)